MAGIRLPHIRNPFADRDNWEEAGRAAVDIVNPLPTAQAIWDYKLGFGKPYHGPQQLAFPLGGRYAPKTPGWRMERAETGDEWINFDGRVIPHRSSMKKSPIVGEGSYYVPRENVYNLKGPNDELIGSAATYRDPRRPGKQPDVYVSSIYVKPEHRKATAFLDLMNAATHGGRLKPGGSIIDPRLERVFNRRFNPDREKLLRKVEKAVKPKAPPKPTQLDRDISELRRAAEHGRGMQVTNRDIGHPLTPVRRPPTPRPARERALTPTQQQLRLSNELRDRRRGGR